MDSSWAKKSARSICRSLNDLLDAIRGVNTREIIIQKAFEVYHKNDKINNIYIWLNSLDVLHSVLCCDDTYKRNMRNMIRLYW